MPRQFYPHGPDKIICTWCNGTGGRDVWSTNGIDHPARWRDCQYCGGKGHRGSKRVPTKKAAPEKEFSWGWCILGATGGLLLAHSDYSNPSYQWWFAAFFGWLWGYFRKIILGLLGALGIMAVLYVIFFR